MKLVDLPLGQRALVRDVTNIGDNDGIARRLRELGFVHGEPVRVTSYAPFGRDPLVVVVGTTRFALRRSEAERIRIDVESATGAVAA